MTGAVADRFAVDVVVLTWNDGEVLDAAVRSVLASTGCDPRCWVIDNASDPPASPVGDGVQLVRNATNLGVARGRNQGARLGSAPFLCFLDSDAQLWPDTLARLLRPMLDDPGVGVTAPVFDGQLPEASAGRAPTPGRKLLRLLGISGAYAWSRRGRRGEVWDVDFAIGACQLIRRDAFESVGGLDETIFFGPEDVDFCLRVRGAGWRVVQVPTAHCEHPARRRFRNVLTRRGADHVMAVARYSWRHRRHLARRPPRAVPSRA